MRLVLILALLTGCADAPLKRIPYSQHIVIDLPDTTVCGATDGTKVIAWSCRPMKGL
jgi:hypothetical protein